MASSGPSQADRELSKALAARGVSASPRQLERWRQAGLLPSRDDRRWPGRGSGSTSKYHQAELEQAAELAPLLGRGRDAHDAALVMFARGWLIREDTLEAAYLGWLDEIEKWIKRCSPSDDPFEIAEAAAGTLIEHAHHKRVRRWLRRLRRRRVSAAHKAAKKMAVERERSKPTPDELAQAREQQESPHSILRSALTAAIHVFLVGKATSEDALSELLDAGGVSAIAKDQAANLGPLVPALPLGKITDLLSGMSKASLVDLVKHITMPELERARDEARLMTEFAAGFSAVITMTLDLPDAFGFTELGLNKDAERLVATCGTLAMAVVRRRFNESDNRSLDDVLAGFQGELPRFQAIATLIGAVPKKHRRYLGLLGAVTRQSLPSQQQQQIQREIQTAIKAHPREADTLSW